MSTPHPESHCYDKGFCDKTNVVNTDKIIRASAALKETNPLSPPTGKSDVVKQYHEHSQQSKSSTTADDQYRDFRAKVPPPEMYA